MQKLSCTRRSVNMAIMKERQPVTLRDVAKLAGVSYQAVSLVVNDKLGVSDETRTRLRKLLHELDYYPNKGAQMLSTNRSRMLELFWVDVHYAGRLADMTKNMANTAKGHGYSLLVSETDAAHLKAAVREARSRLVDGVILYAPRLQLADEELLQLFDGLPMVRRDFVPGSRLPWVGFDQVYATRLATEHLIGLGHRHIAAIPPELGILNGLWRANTCRTVLLGHGLTPGPVAYGDYSIGSGYSAALRLLESGEAFTAVVVGTDNMALGAIRAFRERGLNVPTDVSIVSFDNTEFAAYLEPPLTTVDFPFSRQDEVAVSYLLELLDTPDMTVHQRLLTPKTPELVVRESTQPPPETSTAVSEGRCEVA